MNSMHNPWKGLDSYSNSDSEYFFGRNNETDSLINAILNSRFTILYGPSGVGKSSILNAGVCPRLLNHNYFVVNISFRQLDLRAKESVAAQILNQIKIFAKENDIDITPLSKENLHNDFEGSLWYFFYTNEFWSSKNELLIPIIILDQFEDIFKEEISENITESFFQNIDELSNVVPPLSIREKIQAMDSFRYNQSSEFHIVYSLREDYIPRLDDYVYSINIPELKKSRFGISLMDINQAREVILGPAKGLVTPIVADKIIKILSTQSLKNRTSHKIEPFLLSLFMYRVYIEMTKRGLSTISEELINKIGADVVNDFYIENMKKVSSKAMKYLEDVLLTPKGHRDSISYDKLIASERVTQKELNLLLASRIIKKYTVNNVDRYEFTHDILSKYAQKNKEKREHSNKFRIIVGFCGLFLTIGAAGVIGWLMRSTLTYISIPILVLFTLICSLCIFNTKTTLSKSKLFVLLTACLALACVFNFIQILPSVGYILFGCVEVASFYVIYRFQSCVQSTESKKHNFRNYIKSVVIWILSFIITPCLCFGYNIFIGMNYSRGSVFSENMFYIQNKHGLFGIRDRSSILISPVYDDTLKTIEDDYIVCLNGKYGLIDTTFSIKTPSIYEEYIINDNNIYFYLAGKELSENGLEISWDKSVSDKQKKTLRKIIQNMVFVEGDEFEMGTNLKEIQRKYSGYKPINGEENVHKVILSDFYMGKFEVTVGEWIDIMGFDPRKKAPILKSDSISDLKIPICKISYEESLKFIEKISDMTGLNFSLPSEAQWEYAAKGGIHHDDFDFAGSNSEFDVGWVDRNSDRVPHAVGEKKENSLGLSDMTGNVTEFCLDCMSDSFYIDSDGAKDPVCISSKSKKMIVTRGGCYETANPHNYIITRRTKVLPNIAYRSCGFRLSINP